MGSLLVVEYFPAEYPTLERFPLVSKVFSKMIRAQRYKRNPRSLEYIRGLAGETLGIEPEAIRNADGVTGEEISQADRIVLLWPDGNGYGWSRIEKTIFRYCKDDASVSVLNGRRRFFPLSPEIRSGYRLRRIIEKFWIGEALFVPVFAVFTLPFLLMDKIRGKR